MRVMNLKTFMVDVPTGFSLKTAVNIWPSYLSLLADDI